ncbi:protein CASC3 [Cylas formicarius]|uniref:protein CASC3 n=1 Tax=Cylas formicarius TaxID=197179 RepID=UPI002958A580|nr:protein CASC3 [Cylas formicarius]
MEEMENVVMTEKIQENPASGEEKTSPDNSEYDSVDSYSDEEQTENKSRFRTAPVESRSETESSIILEREEGDGQESVPAKRIDDDEDKKNPQYIPKRGTFYEHDDRCAETEVVETTEVEKTDKDNKKKVWQEKKEKWSHDRFNDNEQAPKSRAELIAIYGYDIRNEEGPPRARRRRRYGRGPNKYTRKWEDEEAYSKPVPKVKSTTRKQPQPKQNKTEFPPLGVRQNRIQSRSSESNVEEDIEAGNIGMEYRRSSERDQKNKPEQPRESIHIEQSQMVHDSHTNKEQVKASSTHSIKPKKEIKDSDYRGFTAKTKQQRGVRSEQQKVLPSRNPRKDSTEFIHSQNFTNKNEILVEELEKNINNLALQDGTYNTNKHGNNQGRQGSVPPRLQQSEQKGPKRYSSMRQRSLPETGTPPVPPYSHSFYPSDYNSAAPPPPSQQPILPPTALPPSIVAQQVPVTGTTATALMRAPFAGSPYSAQAPPGAFIQAPTPAFIPAPQQAQIVSYVTQAQPGFGAAGYQGFQQQFNTVSPPAELYQPQVGITYYSTDQQIPQRSVPQKRPKAAIPIVDPTEVHEKHKEIDEFVEHHGGSVMNLIETNIQDRNHKPQGFSEVND